ncbi:MAG TPA: rhamnulokinase family protein [Candidatus Limnocylindrales bacterium]|nr:rhamnulokinase family protein [Candidatus Limnocylindrales bacterium]
MTIGQQARAPMRLAAVDLGAESGRVIVGSFDGERLSLEDAHRFPNVPVRVGGTLHWDVLRLYGDVVAGLKRAGSTGAVASVGVDTWGVDFALLDARGRLLANPVHYRDARTEGMVAAAMEVVSLDELHAITGIQTMPINTLFQLLAMARSGDPLLAAADRLLMTADLFAHYLGGAAAVEYTLASTSQCLDARGRAWAYPMLERLGIPTRILPELVEPGTVLGGLTAEAAEATGLSGTRVVAPGSHDTQSAIAATPLASPRTAFLSSGTWSLIGLEVPDPVISPASLAGRLTNEGGVGGTISLLSNVVGLWLVQESRRALWPAGDAPSYEELAAMAEQAPAFTAFVDPDDERFLRPGNLPRRVREYCAETGQTVPEDTGTLMRVLLESLALRYAAALERLGEAVGWPVEGLHVVGGGSSHRLLCRLTAGATGVPVRAGPVEATAIGNVAVQAIAAGELASIAEARDLVARSFPMTAYEPEGDWSVARARFAELTTRP